MSFSWGLSVFETSDVPGMFLNLAANRPQETFAGDHQALVERVGAKPERCK